MYRNSFGLLQTVEFGMHVEWAYFMHNRFYVEVLGKDKRKQGVTKISSFLGILFAYAREQDLALKLMKAHTSGVVKANPLKSKKII